MLHTFGYGREIEISTRRATSANETPFQSPSITWYYGPGESKDENLGLRIGYTGCHKYVPFARFANRRKYSV
jgi:hypothetical protein